VNQKFRHSNAFAIFFARMRRIYHLALGIKTRPTSILTALRVWLLALAPYSFLAKHCMPAGMWAQSKRRWLMERKRRRRFWLLDNRAHPLWRANR
jgi:hypothetical protein